MSDAKDGAIDGSQSEVRVMPGASMENNAPADLSNSNEMEVLSADHLRTTTLLKAASLKNELDTLATKTTSLWIEKMRTEDEKTLLVHQSQRFTRNKSVQWADWELKDVMEFNACDDNKRLIDDAAVQTDTEGMEMLREGGLPLVDSLVQTSMDISSLARSRTPSTTTCTTLTSIEEDDERQAALSDLITHLEDTAALLRDYLQPQQPNPTDTDFTSYEQTVFLLKYQLVLVSFIQLVSLLLLTLFDHLTHHRKETGYVILTRSCGTILQILNMLLVSFATVVLSKQMLKYKVEGKFMAQTYLATVITFGGLYFVIYRFQPDAWEFGSMDKMEDSIAATQFIKMLYLSVSAATLCGAANIQPRLWFVILILCFQSLINFVYFSAILAQTIGNYHSYTVQVVRRTSSISRLRSRST